MKRLKKLHGVLVPIITPMFENGSVDIEGLVKLAQTFLDTSSVNGLFVLGATGEYMHFNQEERENIFRSLRQVQKGEKVIIVNTGGLPKEETIGLTEFAAEEGFDCVSIPIPSYDADNDISLFPYFEEIGRIGIPFMVYWPPGGKKPLLAMIKRLMKVSAFVGIKDSSRDMELFMSMCASFGKTLNIFQGVETLHLPSLICGSSGVIGGGLNLYPGLLSQITEAFHSHNLSKAQELQLKVINFWKILSKNGNARWLCKKEWKDRGVIQGDYCKEGKGFVNDPEQISKVREMVLL